MGIFGDSKSRVVMEYRADVEQAKVALRELAGEEKKTAQAAIQGQEDRIKAHEMAANKIAATAAVIGGVVTAGVLSWKSYEEQTRLTTASASISISKLRDASHGLLTDLELMKVAADGANGKWHLTTEEMTNVLGAARQLELEGLMPIAEAAAKLGEVVKKGEIDPLKELGIAYDEQLAKYDKRGAAMKALAQLAEQSAQTNETETESFRRTGTEAENYYNRAKAGVGEFVHESVAGLVIMNDKLLSMRASFNEWISRDLTFAEVTTQARMMAAFAELDRQTQAMNRRFAQAAHDEAQAAENRRQAAAASDALRQYGLNYQAGNHTMTYDEYLAKKREAAGGRGGGGGYTPRGPSRLFSGAVGWLASRLPEQGTYEYELLQTYIAQQNAPNAGLDFGELGMGESDALSAPGPWRPRGMSFAEKLAIGQGTRAPTIAEKLFGKPSEIDAYKTAWSGLTDALVAGYDAMVSGSESAGKAIKHALASAIHGVGQKMFVRGIEETAEAIISWDPRHAAAAAAFFAGSAAAGAIANQMGYGQAVGAGGGRAGAGAGAGSSASGIGLTTGGPVNNTYILGADIGYEPERSRAARFRRDIRNADRFKRPSEGVEYS